MDAVGEGWIVKGHWEPLGVMEMPATLIVVMASWYIHVKWYIQYIIYTLKLIKLYTSNTEFVVFNYASIKL